MKSAYVFSIISLFLSLSSSLFLSFFLSLSFSLSHLFLFLSRFDCPYLAIILCLVTSFNKKMSKFISYMSLDEYTLFFFLYIVMTVLLDSHRILLLQSCQKQVVIIGERSAGKRANGFQILSNFRLWVA